VYVRGDRAVISVEKLRDLIADHSIDCSATHLYLCAPGDMTEAVLQNLDSVGWEKSNVHVDFFGPKLGRATNSAGVKRCPI